MQRIILKSEGLSTRTAKKNSSESSRLISEADLKVLLSISSVLCDGKMWDSDALSFWILLYCQSIRITKHGGVVHLGL